MAIKDYFFNAVKGASGAYDRIYNAQDVTSYLDLLVGNGVFPNPSTNLQVQASSGMGIIVNPGQGWINGHKMINTAALPLTLSGSDVLLNRIDRVIFYVDYTTRSMGIEVLEGTPATTPTAPALTRNENRIEYSLATIAINKQVSSITQANITDTRADSTVCGWVQGLIQQVSTATLFNQWQAAYTEFFEELESWEAAQKALFTSWLDTLTQELKVETYIEQYHKYVTLSQSDSKIVSLDMAGYTYSSTDVIFISLNGLTATENVDYLLDTRTTPVQVHLNFVGSTNTTDEVDIKILKSRIGFSQMVDSNGNAIVTDGGDNLIG